MIINNIQFKMKVSGKVLLVVIYFVVTFIATASIQANPQFQ
jgi:hypothetical protein